MRWTLGATARRQRGTLMQSCASADAQVSVIGGGGYILTCMSYEEEDTRGDPIQSKQEGSSLQLCSAKIDQTGGIPLRRYSRSDYTHPLVHPWYIDTHPLVHHHGIFANGTR